MKILCFGKNGQVAKELFKTYADARFVSSNECNFLEPLKVKEFLESVLDKPDIIINAAAYTKVDLAEEEQDQALNINCNSIKILAEYCKANNIILLSFSTDYVFDGNGTEEYKELDASREDIFKPVNFYGFSKLEGERAIVNSGCKYYIIRTSWVYGDGANFVKTMANLITTKEEIKVINDQIGSPTYAGDIANAVFYILKNQLPFGTYHCTNEGFISWFEFAVKIKDILSTKYTKLANIIPVSSDVFKTKAKRPLNSRLKKEKLKDIVVPFEDSLTKYLTLL
jgi:dTDP-4-dehydrorhamnose reductase